MNNIKIDYINNTITVARGFYTAAQNYGTEEQATLCKLQKEFPHMKISIRSSRKGRRNENKGLTYAYMRGYIRKIDKKNIATFEEVIAHYDTLYSGTECYLYVKDWFLENYPEYKEVFDYAAPTKIPA